MTGSRACRHWLYAVLAAVAAGAACSSEPDATSSTSVATTACDEDAAEIYERRIEPVLADDRPKSCNQCHLSGVDLGLFVRDTPCESMACLIDMDLVDLEEPENSRILTWIERAAPESELITEDVIQAEYDGFLEWIEQTASCTDSACLDAECGPPGAGATCEEEPLPTEVTGEEELDDCSDLSIEHLFKESVYAWRGRCFPCHFSDQQFADETAPRWLNVEDNCDAASLETLRTIVQNGYIDVENPAESLLLLKPLPESEGGVEHGGHDKFQDTSDPAYVSFLNFFEQYADCVR
ncbi:MAG TPA: hypothetical protein VF989_15390 [Polyangiaceae bacterium]